MTPQTVQQLLQVFRIFRENLERGIPLHRSYHEAVRSVAQSYSVTYQTIGDGCRRRLRLNDISELFALLSAWLQGDPNRLVHQLKVNSESSAHAEIDRFFTEGTVVTSQKQKAPIKALASNDFETISFRLLRNDARMLRALAELEGVSVGVVIGGLISESVRPRIKGIVENSSPRV